MSFTPVFEIGLWNAWIFILGMVLISYGLRYLIVNKKATLFIWPQYNEKEKKLNYIYMVIYYASGIYSIFLPLKLGTAWFYAGFFIYLLGMIFVTMTMLSFATTSVDKAVTKGVFRISRNPMYFGFFLIPIGIGIACASWVFLLCAMLSIILLNILAIPEERMCLERYGNAYREYMNKTPKWIGIPKFGKK